MELGYATVYIDKLTCCLQDVSTGEIVDTEVIRLKKTSTLRKFHSKNGWYTNWSRFPKEVEIYALVLKGTEEIQGLVGVYNDIEAGAAYIQWMCTAPHNNKEYGQQKYFGVGGHLFSIAVKKSVEWGYDGCVYGIASDKKLLEHYVNELGADSVPILHPNQFILDERAGKKIEEVYDYEWTDKEI